MSVSIRQHVTYPNAKPKAAAKPYKREAVMHTTNSTKKGYQSKAARGRPWTEEETKLLTDLFGKVDPSVIAAAIHRTVAAVNHRASCLGLGK